jgi:predicted MFS family arabinose efflux permease
MGVAFGGGGAMAMLVSSGCMQMNWSLGWTYLLGAAVGGAFFLALFAMEEPRRGAQDEALQDTVGAGKGEYGHHIELADLKALMQRPINLLLGIAMVFFQFPPAVLTIWFVTFLMRNHGLSELTATQLTLLAFAGQPVGNVLGGVIADRAYKWKRSGRVAVMIVMAAVAPLFLIVAFTLPFKLISFVPMMIVANFFIIAGGPAFAAVSLEVNLPEHRGTISAFLAICTSVALGFAWYVPPLIAKAMGGRYHHALIMTAAAYLPLIVTYILMKSHIEEDLDRVKNILGERAKQIQNQTSGGRSREGVISDAGSSR